MERMKEKCETRTLGEGMRESKREPLKLDHIASTQVNMTLDQKMDFKHCSMLDVDWAAQFKPNHKTGWC